MLVLDAQLGDLEDGCADGVCGEVDLQGVDGGRVNAHLNVTIAGPVHLLDVRCNLAQGCFLNAALDNACGFDVQVIVEVRFNDGRADVVGCVDDLFDAGHSKRHVHAGDSCKMESLKGHLRAWLANTLCSHRPHRRPSIHHTTHVPRYAVCKKVTEICCCAAVQLFHRLTHNRFSLLSCTFALRLGLDAHIHVKAGASSDNRASCGYRIGYYGGWLCSRGSRGGGRIQGSGGRRRCGRGRG
mmetsp:Transcript_45660/g.74456  ORF Transcript_45660/g.74456 Transcript_45660/m.74456 type:complete len:241 (+) Transcript_45660:877-1599(+)